MSHPYDALVAVSEKLAGAPLRRHIEGPTLFAALGDVAGHAVLELACGTGLYARQVARRGAAKVVGVDQSEAQIACARHIEAQDPLGVDFRVGDAALLEDLGVFDVVVASHLLHYAPTSATLGAMCRNARRSLVDGGRLVALVMNTADDGSGIAIGVPGWYSPYGFEVSGEEGRRRRRAHVGDGRAPVPDRRVLLVARDLRRGAAGRRVPRGGLVAAHARRCRTGRVRRGTLATLPSTAARGRRGRRPSPWGRGCGGPPARVDDRFDGVGGPRDRGSTYARSAFGGRRR